MALYGIDGLMPLATMVSADASAVRTMYRLETGEIVELVQEKAGAVEAARGNVAPTATANQGQAAQAQTGQIQGQGQGQGQAQTAQPPQPWTAVRDNVRLTLRGGGNLAALGERLRPE
jgi:hypothetical protein